MFLFFNLYNESQWGPKLFGKKSVEFQCHLVLEPIDFLCMDKNSSSKKSCVVQKKVNKSGTT